MIDDDNDSELFEGKVEISSLERGATLGSRDDLLSPGEFRDDRRGNGDRTRDDLQASGR